MELKLNTNKELSLNMTIGNTEKYNGWSNWHTWDAYNHITSYEGSWMRASECRSVNRLKNEFGPWIKLQENEIDVNEINWEELFEAI